MERIKGKPSFQELGIVIPAKLVLDLIVERESRILSVPYEL